MRSLACFQAHSEVTQWTLRTPDAAVVRPQKPTFAWISGSPVMENLPSALTGDPWSRSISPLNGAPFETDRANDERMAFTLESIVPWGRSYSEYAEMFALDEADLGGRILGCGDGPASFNAEATENKYHVVSCDPLYRFSASEIQQRVRQTHRSVVAQLEINRSDFCWDRFRDPVHLGKARLKIMERFLEDFPQGVAAGRYVEAALPALPFADAAFDLALCSHFLFLYSAQNPFQFHLASLRELCRVASEVRVFPLLDLGGMPSPHVEPTIEALSTDGYHCDRIKVAYEFQRGGNHMLRIRARSAA